MRHRIKKIPTLSKLKSRVNKNHHLLHSDESTYFYKGKSKVATLFGFASRSTNDIRWTSRNRIPFGAVISTRSSRETTSYSGIGSQTLSSHISYRKMAGRANMLGNSRFSTIPLVLSTFGLLLVLGMMVFPFDSSYGVMHGVMYGVGKAYAEESNADNDISAQMEVPTSGVALEIDTTLPEDNTIVEQVNGSGTKYISVNFTVGANDIDKYQVFVQADSTNLTGSTNKDVISSISTPTLGTNIDTKQWGYSVAKNHNVDANTLTYNTIQTDVSTPADTVEAASGSKLTNITQAYTLAFAANLDGAKADHYKSNITLSVAANAEEVTTSTEFLGFYGINYMQDMTPAICEKARVGEVARLIDKRDQKLYWIGKLADNNCWMTQNLDLDLWDEKTDTAITLTPNNSDINMDWTSDSGSGNSTWVQIAGGEGAIARNATRYYTPNGDYVLTKPTIRPADTCGLLDSESCQAVGWINVSTMTSSNDPAFGVGVNDGYYNAHYLSGNYYTWNAATAGQASSFDDKTDYPVNATQSICPKGWTLPENNSTASSYAQSKSYGKMLQAYGAQSGSGLIFGIQDVRLAPIYLLEAGFVGDGTLKSAGRVGTYWESTSESYSGAYDLGFDSYLSVNGQHSLRSWGQTVRCVAR